MVAITTVMGPVGPEIWEGVPPNRAAKNPTKIAPYRPAVAPPSAPDETPKARANGKATMAAVMPPKKSPRKFLKWRPWKRCGILRPYGSFVPMNSTPNMLDNLEIHWNTNDGIEWKCQC